ncbi:CaiB/BaiF CoA transferase family protein [Chloroflexota bacterium]
MGEQLPLEGIRVVELSTAGVGPGATKVLTDLGAEVIKIESREHLDAWRMGRPVISEDIVGGDRGEWPDMQPYFHRNCNKLSVTINTKRPAGLKAAKALIGKSDVLLCNFSAGVLERMGLGYKNLVKLRPDIIVISMTGAGESGPLKDILSYAPVGHALSGLMCVNGYPGEDTIGAIQSPFGDFVAALYGAMAIVAALHHRNLTGEGQYIEQSQLECNAAMLGEAFLEFQMTGSVPKCKGNISPGLAPCNNYPCLGDDKWVSIAVKTDEEWKSFCRVLGDPPWTKEPEFADRYLRLTNREALDNHVSEWTAQHTAEEVTRILQDQEVAAAPVNNIGDQFSDSYFSERGAFKEVDHPLVGAEWVPGLPWLMSETPEREWKPAPLLGQHNDYVFKELLHMSDSEIAEVLAGEPMPEQKQGSTKEPGGEGGKKAEKP